MSSIVQHQDRNIGPGAYRGFSPDELLVTSIFHTIQGEGPFAGTPAIFIRLAGCNRGEKHSMGCAFCDTDFRFDRGRRMRFDDIFAEMETEIVSIPPLIVITGGEPMMQDNLSPFVRRLLRVPQFRVQIESNGDRLAPDFPEDARVTLVVSPKVSQDYCRPLRQAVLDRLDALKFLVSAAPGSPYHQLPNWAHEMSTKPILISPITVYKTETASASPASIWDQSLIDVAATRSNYAYAAKLAMRYGYRVSLQTHLWLEVA